MKSTLYTGTFLLFLLGPVWAVYASDIQYGSLKEQYGNTVLLEYRGPAGMPTLYSCTIENKCKKLKDGKTTLYPTLLGSQTYPVSEDGSLGVKEFALGTTAFYFLYDISHATPKKLAQLPYTTPGTKVRITKNNTAVIFQQGLNYVRYDIATKELRALTLGQELAFSVISPNGTYVTGYNYNTLAHELWRFSDGKKLVGPPSMQSYLEFSDDEKQVAFLEDVRGFRTLFTMKTADIGKEAPSSLKQLTTPNTETEDYLFAGNTLYFLANVDGPLEWDLFSHDGKTVKTVDTDVSYGDYVKQVKTKEATYLAYLKTDGKNTNVVLVDSDAGKTTLTPVKASPLSEAVTRKVTEYGKRTGVLLSPKKTSKGDLFIWMHGGPQRQVAKEYHPYLSYAVYDELLERLTEAGNHVFKIDYTGSSGYGADFRKALTMKVGDVEMKDVKNAIRDIKKDLKVNNVYLIGNSYGGYMALRGIVDMKDVAGAISINGVSDWYGLIQQIPSSPFISVFNGVPDMHNLDAYFKASVFSGMEALSKDKKVLVVWGENDSTVPVWQSTKYVDFAKNLDVTVKTLSFSDEDHILRKRVNLDALCKSVASTFGLKNVPCGK